MTDKELKHFLNSEILAFLATVKGSSPQITPLNFLYDGEYVLVSVGANSQKVKNILENNEVAVCVHSKYHPDGANKGVIFKGFAEIQKENVDNITKKIFMKGHNLKEREDMLSNLVKPRVIIRIKPTKIISWDYSKILKK